MFQHVGHALVCLGEGPRLLACLQTGLGGWLHPEALEVLSELVIGHEHVLHRLRPAHALAEVLDQGALAGAHFLKMLLQQRHVEFDHWVGVHPQRLINHQQLAGWETHLEFVEQLLGHVHIVLAVLAVLSEVSLSEVSLALTQCSHHLVALLAQTVVRRQLGKRSTHSDVVQWAGHAQGVQPQPWLDAEVPRQDGPIERCVVAQDGPLAVVQ